MTARQKNVEPLAIVPVIAPVGSIQLLPIEIRVLFDQVNRHVRIGQTAAQESSAYVLEPTRTDNEMSVGSIGCPHSPTCR